ncbi:hypothetical protein SLA2020_190760 [Shorea laevis]
MEIITGRHPGDLISELRTPNGQQMLLKDVIDQCLKPQRRNKEAEQLVATTKLAFTCMFAFQSSISAHHAAGLSGSYKWSTISIAKVMFNNKSRRFDWIWTWHAGLSCLDIHHNFRYVSCALFIFSSLPSL